ncbi:hypothetical protein U1707_17640 [Sphingomonas sp. PB2P12]
MMRDRGERSYPSIELDQAGLLQTIVAREVPDMGLHPARGIWRVTV